MGVISGKSIAGHRYSGSERRATASARIESPRATIGYFVGVAGDSLRGSPAISASAFGLVCVAPTDPEAASRPIWGAATRTNAFDQFPLWRFVNHQRSVCGALLRPQDFAAPDPLYIFFLLRP